ncbi:MAG: XdhC family protein [Elusimicrobia bacterium]|nr:XdhC family protein [Elusimicrobiota bacterium]
MSFETRAVHAGQEPDDSTGAVSVPVFRETVRSLKKGEPVVLTTVVRTEGSTPQKPGAKLLVRSDGSTAGTLGGGCVENDLRAFALEALREGRPAHLREYVLNEAPSSSRGMVCGGRMEFLIDPILKPADYLPAAEAILGALGGGAPVVVACVAKAPAGGKALVGSKLLSAGDRSGSLGSPDLDEAALAAGRELMAEDCGFRCLPCEGGVEVFVEAYVPPPMIVMLGGGHIAQALEPLGKMAGMRFCVIDDRPEFANRERFAAADDALSVDFGAGLARLAVHENDFIVVATRGHRLDDAALEAAAATPARYVGLLGSRRKVGLIFAGLRKKGVPEGRVAGIHAPIGLDIGGRTPAEIALSIMAEIVMHRRGGTGLPMKAAGERKPR